MWMQVYHLTDADTFTTNFSSPAQICFRLRVSRESKPLMSVLGGLRVTRGATGVTRP